MDIHSAESLQPQVVDRYELLYYGQYDANDMMYGLYWRKKVRRKEAAWREASKIELRFTALPPCGKQRKLYRYFCLSARKDVSVSRSKQTDPQRDLYHSMAENLISSTGSELV